MNILICNDDGYLAQGIRTLAKVTAEFANVRVVAPERDRSASATHSRSTDLCPSIRLKMAFIMWMAPQPTVCT